MKWPRVALVGFAVAMAAVHAIVAFWTPIQGDDWGQWVWAAHHRGLGAGGWLVKFAATHFTFADAMSFILARSTAFHVLVSPAVGLALVLGVTTLALRRLPRASWDDVLAVVLVSALIWIGGARAGVVWFHRPYVAMDVYGVAVAVWLLAAYRCGWTVPRWAWPLLALAGYAAGTATRTIATATLVGVIVMIRAVPRAQRARWMWIGLGGLGVGTFAGYVKPPWLEVMRVFHRGLEPNLILFDRSLREAGEVVSLVLALVLIDRVLAALDRPHADPAEAPRAEHGWRWGLAWLGTTVWAMFGPKYSEATMLPATCALAIGALPYLLWLARGRWLRRVVVGFVAGVHAVVWTLALLTYGARGPEGQARLARLEAGKPGEVVTVAPLSQILPTFWEFGEDLAASTSRQLIAIDVFGVRDIEIAPPFRRYEPNPHVDVKLEVDGITDAQLRAAEPPAIWASDVAAARRQFELLTDRLGPVSARLVVTSVDFAQRAGRPLVIAWSERGHAHVPKVNRAPGDANDRFAVQVKPPVASELHEAFVVHDGQARPIQYLDGHPRIQPMVAGLYVVVACNKDRCVVLDAFVPRF